jgi:hypothetical protein
MIGGFVNKIMAKPYFAMHKAQLTTAVRNAIPILGFAIPAGLTVAWCAFPAMGDETKESLGLPVDIPETGETQWKWGEEGRFAMPVRK